jgi:spore coat protein A, manganese oxidase
MRKLRRRTSSPTTSKQPKAGAIEVWQIMNLTGDIASHPFSPGERAADPEAGGQGRSKHWTWVGDPLPPDANEIGWKETVRMNPGEVPTIIVQFNLPNLPTAALRNAVSPRTGGKEYVWHCHILEHQEHDMMRPLVVD